MTRAGFVLAGGRSSRMGRDKALLMGGKVAAAVRDAVGSAVLVGDPARYEALGCPVIPDLWPDEGPLGGIITALRHTGAELNLIVACDMPMLSADFLKELMNSAEASGILVPVSPEGRLEPLCAVYGQAVLPGLEAAFAGGQRKVTAAFAGLPARPYPVAEAIYFQNINTPEEWASHAGK